MQIPQLPTSPDLHLIQPKSRLIGEIAIPEFAGFGINFFRQSRREAFAKVSPGALGYGYWAWQFSVTVWRRTFTLLWQSERSALD